MAHARARRPKRVQGAPAPPPGVRRGLGVLGVPFGGGGTAAGPRGSAGMGRLMSHWQDATSAVLFWLDWVSPVPDGASLLLVWSWMLVLCAIRSVLEGEKTSLHVQTLSPGFPRHLQKELAVVLFSLFDWAAVVFLGTLTINWRLNRRAVFAQVTSPRTRPATRVSSGNVVLFAASGVATTALFFRFILHSHHSCARRRVVSITVRGEGARAARAGRQHGPKRERDARPARPQLA